MCNFAIGSVVSDVFGKSSSNIIDHVLTNDCHSEEDILTLIHGRMFSKKDQILDSINGSSFTEHQKVRIQLVKQHMTYINDLLGELDDQISLLTIPFKSSIDLICSIPGLYSNLLPLLFLKLVLICHSLNLTEDC